MVLLLQEVGPHGLADEMALNQLGKRSACARSRHHKVIATLLR